MGGFFAASLTTGEIVAAGGSTTIVELLLVRLLEQGLFLVEQLLLELWLADKISKSIVKGNETSSDKINNDDNVSNLMKLLILEGRKILKNWQEKKVE